MENIDIDIDKEILENIDIDKISNRLEFGISNRAIQQGHEGRLWPSEHYFDDHHIDDGDGDHVI